MLSADMNIEDSIGLFNNKVNCNISKVVKKNGQVIIFPWDLATEEISSFNGNSSIWGEITSNFNNTIVKNRGNVDTITSLLSKVKYVRLPSFQLMIILFILYILIIGVLIYIVLKRLNKRDYVWILIPIISIGFTVIIYIIGGNSRVQDIIANKVNIVSIDLNGQINIESYLGILTAKNRKVVIEEPKDVDLSLMGNEHYGYGNNFNINENATMRLNMISEGDKTYYNFDEISSFNRQNFKVNNLNGKFEPLKQELRYSKGKVTGYITNNLGCDIKKLVIVTPYKSWDLGTLGNGEKISIEDSDKFTSELQLNEITNKIEMDHYNNGNKIKDGEKYELRTCKLLNYVYFTDIYNSNENTSKIIAITEKEIEYDLKVNGKAPLDKNDTVFINNIDINYKLEDGTIEYPYGYFIPSIIEENSMDGYYDPNKRFINGTIELVLGYHLQEDDVLIESIDFKRDSSQNYSSMNGEYKIYNYKINDYEVLNFQDELNLTNIDDYILDGNIMIKIQCTNEKGAKLPDISVKGKVK